MGSLGKVLVFVNVGVTMALAACAGALLYYRTDWSDAAATADQPAGVLVERKARLKEFQEAVRPAEAAFRAARSEVLNRESRRPAEQMWYASELARLREDDGKPVFALALDDKGYTVPNPAAGDVPTLADVTDRRGQPLHAISWYPKEDAAVVQDLVKQLADLDAAKKKDADLTALLIGDPAAMVKGLGYRIEAEKAKRADVIEEQNLIEPLLVNTYVDNELVLRRKKALENRVRELEAGVADKPR
jgi:hypothetical protein